MLIFSSIREVVLTIGPASLSDVCHIKGTYIRSGQVHPISHINTLYHSLFILLVLRHGGATRDYHNGMQLADIMLRGRWQATKSATHYIQQGRQLMMMRYVPSWVDQSGRLPGRYLVVSILLALSQNTKVSVGSHLLSL